MKFHVLFSFQKLRDIAFPQAEVLKKALLRRFDEEYAQYLVRKVSSWPTTHALTVSSICSECDVFAASSES